MSIGSLDDVYLHQATNGVSTNYNALLDLFERVANFFNRLHIYTGRIPSSPTMSDIVVKIMAKVLGMLAPAMKRINRGQLSGKWPTVQRPVLVDRVTYWKRTTLKLSYKDWTDLDIFR